MAANLYLKIDGITGESTDAEHTGWIEVDNVSFSVSQPKSATASTGGGHTAERCEITDVICTKLADVSTPQLLQLCASGKTVARAKFEFVRSDGAMPVTYFEIDMENVLIARVAPSVSAGSLMSDSLSLKFSKVRWRYTKQKIAGGIGGNTAGGWDLATNRIAA